MILSVGMMLEWRKHPELARGGRRMDGRRWLGERRVGDTAYSEKA